MFPNPTPIYRLMHVDNLRVCVRRGALHAPNHMPSDGLQLRDTHNIDLQRARSTTAVPSGPRGHIHDYIPFYFGPLSPMLLQLKTGWVEGYCEGQYPLVYLVSSAQAVDNSGHRFVFTDGHAHVAYTKWYDNLNALTEIDWEAVNARYWGFNNDPTGELKRRKQAEFLVHTCLDWKLIEQIAVMDDSRKAQVEDVLAIYDLDTPVSIRRDWYY